MPELGAPAITVAPGQFLLKDVGLLAVSFWFIQKLLAEAGAANIDRNLVAVEPRGFEVAADWATLKSPESYLGYVRMGHFASPGGVNRNQPRAYELPARLRPNEWALAGDWTVREDAAVLNSLRGGLEPDFTPGTSIS